MQRWEGRVALVTGASAGIGAAIAEALVKHGMIVVGIARRAEKIEALAKELSGHKGKLYSIKGDVRKEDDIKAAFSWVENNLKSPVHVLVNNAAFSVFDTPLDGDTEDWRQTLEVNVLGLSICTREAIKSMKAHDFDEGHIFNINSVVGHTVMTHLLAMYTASKFAVTALTEALRKQLSANKSKTRVTSISPGAVRTEALSRVMGNDELTRTALPPSDIADSVIYALSLRQHVHINEITITPNQEAVASASD